MGKGGGGGTATSDTAPYLKQAHAMMLMGIDMAGDNARSPHAFFSDTELAARDPTNLFDASYNAASGDCPYTSEVAYDAGSLEAAGEGDDSGDELLRAQYGVQRLQSMTLSGGDITDPSLGTELAPQTILADWLNTLESASFIETAVANFRANSEQSHLRSVNELLGSLVTINAVNSSACVMGRAILEVGRENRIEAYRMMLIDQLLTKTLQLWTGEARVRESVADLQLRASTMSIVDHVDRSRINRDLSVMDLLWDIDVWSKAANMLSATAGAVTSDMREAGPSRAASALAGGLSGAGTGAMMGGPLGAVAGGLIGGAAGLLM